MDRKRVVRQHRLTMRYHRQITRMSPPTSLYWRKVFFGRNAAGSEARASNTATTMRAL